MGLGRRSLICSLFFLLLLSFLLANGEFGSSGNGSDSTIDAAKIHADGSKLVPKNGDDQKQDTGDDIFGDGKRRVYSGANPLHNR
ncbi:hypothetical protein F511_45856 [Dorcoceras hygrometricum]|uniref:Uncharacterized protein n=1 Tax=Dorcoceras hygrometricum TaxID=472368 RepID=A0A2Z6ZW45_9LAMI|nr:hypothetical protein F511_45856 [Dorcoceras hygrometricum]